jgi:hypothetical protein
MLDHAHEKFKVLPVRYRLVWRMSAGSPHEYGGRKHTNTFLNTMVQDLVDGWDMFLFGIRPIARRCLCILFAEVEAIIFVVVGHFGSSSGRETDLTQLRCPRTGGDSLFLLTVLFGKSTATLTTISLVSFRL